MKVLHLLSSNKYSGAENVVCQIIKMFDKDAEMVYCSPDGDIKKTLEEKNIKFIPLKELSKKELKKAVKDYNPDIIHAHDLKACLFASKIKNVKLISHMHVNHPKMKKVSLRSIIALNVLKKFSHIYWVSNSAYNDFIFKDKLKNTSEVLPNIISLKELNDKVNSSKEEAGFDIVYCGRITEQKDPLRIVDIAKLVCQKKPDVTFGIIGDGDKLEELKKYAVDKGVQNVVSFLGFKSYPFSMIKNSRLMILTSKFEGTPMTALESLSLGTPIISTKTDGMVDLLNDKIGLLYDTNEEASDLIVDLLSNEEKIEKMSKSAVEFSTKYNDIKNYKSILESNYRS